VALAIEGCAGVLGLAKMSRELWAKFLPLPRWLFQRCRNPEAPGELAPFWSYAVWVAFATTALATWAAIILLSNEELLQCFSMFDGLKMLGSGLCIIGFLVYTLPRMFFLGCSNRRKQTAVYDKYDGLKVWSLRKPSRAGREDFNAAFMSDEADDAMLELDEVRPVCTQDAFRLDPSQLTLFKLPPLGSGNFGTVTAAILTRSDGTRVEVAVKVPAAIAVKGFQKEIELMIRVQTGGGHSNVVAMLGYVQRKAKPMLALEMMALGSLDVYLAEHRAPAPPAMAELVQFAVGLARGMAFIAGTLKIVHRDLAARNCLLSADKVCKIADFGLSRGLVENKDYYRVNEESDPIPVKWMPPETLQYGTTTTESDRWSFGVLVWEIASLAARPYPGVANKAVLEHIELGGRPKLPAGRESCCPAELQELMQQCWSAEPADRPPFQQITDRLDAIHAALLPPPAAAHSSAPRQLTAVPGHAAPAEADGATATTSVTSIAENPVFGTGATGI